MSVPFLICAVAVGIFLSYADPTDTESKKQCNINKTQECSVFDNGQQVSIQFLNEIEVEEEIIMTIELPENAKIEAMWVQGVNMYMGKNAVVIDGVYEQGTKKVYNARLFLGSCSEPAMKWQMIIQTSINDELKKSWFFNFSTDRNKKS
jgi:hypothetical protein